MSDETSHLSPSYLRSCAFFVTAISSCDFDVVILSVHLSVHLSDTLPYFIVWFRPSYLTHWLLPWNTDHKKS